MALMSSSPLDADIVGAEPDGCRDLRTEGKLPQAYCLPAGAERGSWSDRAPRCVYIEVTNRCNLRCKTCPRTFIDQDRPRTLTWQRFLQVAEQFPAMNRAVLHGIGEPLLNRELPRIISFLKAQRITVLFNSNAVLLDRAWSRLLIQSGLDELRVSLDAAQPGTYARIRGEPFLPRIVDNLRNFTRMQRELGAETPRLSLWMTGMRGNIAELPALIRLASAVGAPEVYVQRLVYYWDPERPPGLMGRDQALFGDVDEQVDHILAVAENLARALGIVLLASGAGGARRSLSESAYPSSSPWKACTRPWTTAYVTAGGDCLPCCISPFATTDYQTLKMGNLFEQRFANVWNGEKYRSWRAALLSDCPSVACRGCGTRWSL